MRNEGKMCEVVALGIGYASNQGGFSRQMSLLSLTNDTEMLKEAVFEIYDHNVIDKPIRQIYISFGRVSNRVQYQQLSLLYDNEKSQKQQQFQDILDILHNKYGNDAVLRASALTEESTAKERHNQIGGHRK